MTKEKAIFNNFLAFTRATRLPPQLLPPFQRGEQFIVDLGVALGELQGAGGIGGEQSAVR